MIKQKISKEIWAMKYQNEKEPEEEFYLRVPKTLFDSCTKKEIDAFCEIMNVNTKDDLIAVSNHLLSNHHCMLAGRPMYALGTDRKEQTFSNCYVIPIKKDSMNSIMECISEAAMTMKSGGGNGYSFSILRPKDSSISTSGGQSTGPISFMKVFDSTCDSIKGGNNRRGAQIGVLDVWHPDIEEFIVVKQEKGVLTNFNISVGISDDFMKAVLNDEDWDLVFPDTTHEKYNDEWNGNLKEWKSKGYPVKAYKTIKAIELYEKIMKATYNYAEPGVLFLDTINNDNNLWYDEYIYTTNPCLTGDALIETLEYGTITLKDVVDKVKSNEKISVLSYNIENDTKEYKLINFGEMTRKDAELIELELEDGKKLKLTPDHRVYTTNRGYVEAKYLTLDDNVKVL